MNRFYTFAMASMVALSSLTASALNLTPVSSRSEVAPTSARVITAADKAETAPLTRATSAMTTKRTTTVAASTQIKGGEAVTAGRKGAPAKRAAAYGDEWTDLGNGKWTDGLLDPLFGWGLDPWEVTVQENVQTPGVYRVLNPYCGSTSPINVFKKANDTADYNLIIDATDPNAVTIVCEDGTYRGYNYAKLGLEVGTYGEDVVAMMGTGTLADGVIKFGEKALLLGMLNDGLYYGSETKLMLPGAKDYTVSIDSETCFDNNLWQFTVNGGADAANMKYVVMAGRFGATTDNYSYVAANGTAFDFALPAELKFQMTEEGWYTIIIASCDADGNLREGAAAYAYCILHNDEEWTSRGLAAFNDDSFCPDYGVTAKIPTYYVELLESKSKPGLYRLVDPYANHPAMSEEYLHSSHKHYLEIDASNAAAVKMADQPVGVNISGSTITLMSNADGKMENHVITFPTKGLVYSEGNNAYYANRSGNFSVTVPYTNVTVTVKDAAGNAVEGATAGLTGVEGAEAVTDAEGIATIKMESALTAGTVYSIYAYKDGYEMAGEASITAVTGTYEYAASVTLDEAVCTLNVKASDSEGEPLEGCYVYLNDEYQEGVTTDANGEAKIALKGAFGKSYNVMVGKDGYEPWTGTVEFTEGYEGYALATLEASVCTASFKVFDQDYEPVAGATVKLEGVDGEFTTDANGSANVTIKGGFGKSYNYTVTKEGYNDASGSVEFTEGLEAYPIVSMTAVDISGITAINADAAAGKVMIYTIQGRRINAVTAPGVYIVNGRKVYVVEK